MADLRGKFDAAYRMIRIWMYIYQATSCFRMDGWEGTVNVASHRSAKLLKLMWSSSERFNNVSAKKGEPKACQLESNPTYVFAHRIVAGSTGYGEKYIQKLVGKCGTLDVAGCIATVEELINLGVSEPGRQTVQGRSHGGFLTAHPGELCVSDISDWPFREPELSFEPALPSSMLRMPPTQGRGYYHVLKGKGRVVEMLVFPKETHPIDFVEAARVSFEAGRDWFRAFTGGK
ncbi:hypothetical protein HD554DRAFT_2035219 [Boletus coccyginus]|nr:hypothetical protein HD554DRAFT_2035219 [Boletus coccyginus]